MRVVVSLTTLPGRESLAEKAIESILRQTWLPDAIYLSLPSDRIPPPQLSKKIAGVQLCHLPDMGPAMKLLPTLAMEPDPDTCIITVDDDVEYPEQLVDKLVRASALFPHNAIGFTGWSVSGFIDGIPNLRHMNQDFEDCCFFHPVQVLEGTRGILYRRSFFADDIHSHACALPAFRYHDDILFSGYLASRGIGRIVRWYNQSPRQGAINWQIHCQSEGLHTTKNWFELGWECWNYWSAGEVTGFKPAFRDPRHIKRLHIVEGGVDYQERNHSSNIISWPIENHLGSDTLHLPITENDSCDEILIAGTALYLSNGLSNLFWECERIIKPGGVIKIILPILESLKRHTLARSGLYLGLSDLCQHLLISTQSTIARSIRNAFSISLEKDSQNLVLCVVKGKNT